MDNRNRNRNYRSDDSYNDWSQRNRDRDMYNQEYGNYNQGGNSNRFNSGNDYYDRNDFEDRNRFGDNRNWRNENTGNWNQATERALHEGNDWRSGDQNQYGRGWNDRNWNDDDLNSRRNSGRGNYGNDGNNSGSNYGAYSSGGYGRNYGSNYNDRGSNDFGSSSYGRMGSRYRAENTRYENERGRNEDRGWWDKTTDEVSSWFGDDDAQRRRRMDKMNEGQHRGRGPKGYRRSDDRIREDVNDRLSDDHYIDASDIEVSVKDGDVTLTGTVDSKMAKRRAEDVAESVSGVNNVQNSLRVNQNSNNSNTGNTTNTPSSETNTGKQATGTSAAQTSGTMSALHQNGHKSKATHS